ncbi:histone-lysine N-methyltransferase SETMAR [Trichonephila clavipes]|nr:histone-lysine N-methyltransferase SETMAR [Trichonephila clavipes]
MESDKQHFRHILLFYYRKGKNDVQARKKLTDVYGEGVLTVRQCQNWFAKFRSGNFDVEDAPRSGRPVEADKDAIKALVDANRRITTREIGQRLNLSNSTVYDHLKGLGLSSKLDVWVPHVLTERNLCRRIDVCDSLLKRHENYPFLKRIITEDKKSHGAKKRNHFQSRYSPKKLDKLNDALQQKKSELINRKGVEFHQDNARPHTSLVTRQKLLQLEWDTTSHPPYSPDLAPSDYYLFRSFQNFLDDGDRFNSCQVIYSQFGLAIHQNDHQARRRFVEWAENEIAVVPYFHERMLFSDEAHFWLNGYVNKQNCRIWSEANPQVYVETPLHPEKLTVWCALWASGIIGPSFKNDEGHNVTVNGDRYRAMITNFFIPEMNNHDVQELWFQQDGATCHTARATIDLLKDTFSDRLISRLDL